MAEKIIDPNRVFFTILLAANREQVVKDDRLAPVRVALSGNSG
jgi:hypothetical protein